MTKDPLIAIQERLNKVNHDVLSETQYKPAKQVNELIQDIQNLLALVRAYREHIYSYDDPNIVDEIESKIFGDKS